MKFNSDETKVACTLCSSWILRGTEYAVQYYETHGASPLGPYCGKCTKEILKVTTSILNTKGN